jgi:hypothetical protein
MFPSFFICVNFNHLIAYKRLSSHRANMNICS